MRRCLVVLFATLGCGGSDATIRAPRETVEPDAGVSSSAGGGGASAGGAATSGGASGGGVVGGGVAPRDAARIISTTFPSSIPCGQQRPVTIVVENVGTTTWTAGDGYKLGAVDDDDPFSDVRVELPDSARVSPGERWAFELTVRAPSSSTSGVSDWRMVREHVTWFGEAVSRTVSVSCGPPAFDLSTVVIQGAPPGAPDVRGFTVTSAITSLAFRPDTFSIDHSRRGQWPPVQIDPDGTTQEATVWVFFRLGGVWYGTGGERLRPNQTDKQLTQASELGPGWLYDSNRWGPMTNYVPQVGEYVGFMVVAGSTRSDANSPVQERSKVVLVPFPADGVTASFPPFAWEEP